MNKPKIYELRDWQKGIEIREEIMGTLKKLNSLLTEYFKIRDSGK